MGTTEERSSIFCGVGLQFKETMAGFLGVGEVEPRRGAALGQSRNAIFHFNVQINIRDLGRFLRVPEHDAELSGTVTFVPLGGTFPIREGRFTLFAVDPRTGVSKMTYAFCFNAGDGQPYFLRGHNQIHDDPGMLDVIPYMTTLFTALQ